MSKKLNENVNTPAANEEDIKNEGEELLPITSEDSSSELPKIKAEGVLKTRH